MYEQKLQLWLKSDYVSETDKKELIDLQEDEKELDDRFYRNLEFGTAGLRGIMGMGTNRMNVYIVDMTTQGLASFISKYGQKYMERGVVIAYDSRNNSAAFAERAALVLAGNGIKTYLFESLRAVPQLSFAIRKLGCISGVVITASHNPPAYNGYKVYWEEGYQLTPEAADAISDEINGQQDFSSIKKLSREAAIEKGLLQIIGEEIDGPYIQEILKGITRNELIAEKGEDINIIYSPLHGSGNIPVRRALTEAGFQNVHIVKEQELPDGNFPTVKEPNPEKMEVFKMAKELAKEKDGDFLIATDPDADRVGVAYKNGQGEFINLTGNEIGILLTNYLLMTKKEQGSLTDKGLIIKSIVSTDLVEDIAAKYGVSVMSTLTGFKYIGEIMEEYSKTRLKDFILGFEESYGYLMGTHARDKDAIMTVLVIAEMVLYYKELGKNLGDVLVDIYNEFGYCIDKIISFEMSGKEGAAKIQKIVDYFRRSMPMKWNGKKVAIIEDYQTGNRNIVGDSVEKLSQPESNVIKAYLEDKSWFCVRPSGTEPKIKIYFSVRGDSMEDAKANLSGLLEEMNEKVASLLN
ncbi:MAG: phospho-sugar mutase [Eubacteriaceae bacterium]|nr:phospho-sugar mutase [Eubacteriaceae bacterium]